MANEHYQRTVLLSGLAFFLLLAGMDGLSYYLAAVRAGRSIGLDSVLSATVPPWLGQVILVWPVRWLSRHARLGPGTWARNLPIHLGASLALLFVAVAGGTALSAALGHLPAGTTFWSTMVRTMISFFPNQVALYGALVAMFHALDYLKESQERERERVRLAISLSEARLNTLRSQLSPHFFFNTLNAISTFALEGRPRQVGEMTGALGDLMRASLDDRLPHLVPLEKELSLLDLYLEIQRVRFADWLRIEIEVGEEASSVLVPSLILQPLVENAIEHGGAGSEHRSRVRIECRIDGNALTLVIENSEPGRARDSYEGLRLGVGLRNTRERLEQLYPGEHSFQFGAESGRGFVTRVRIPARHASPSVAHPETA